MRPCSLICGVVLASGAAAQPHFPLYPGEVFEGGFVCCHQPDLADINSDGALDLIGASAEGLVRVVFGAGDGTFSAPVEYVAGEGAFAVVARDVDGDAILDLVVANAESASISVLLGVGDGTFDAQTEYSAATPSSTRIDAFVAADLNSDSLLDVALVATDSNDQTVRVMLGVGDGTFAPPLSFPTGRAEQVRIVSGDFDADGAPDLAIANGHDAGSQDITILLGAGDGTFGAPIYIPAQVGADQLAALDYDGDGRDDLAYGANTGFGFLYLLSRWDTDHFQTTFLLPAGSSPDSIEVADVDGDTHPDLVVGATQAGSGIHPNVARTNVVRNPGNGAIPGPPLRYSDLGRSWSRVADFNGDGTPDLLTSNDLTLRLGLGGGAFEDRLEFSITVPDVLTDTAVADLNADGRPDLATVLKWNDQPGGLEVRLAAPDQLLSYPTVARTPLHDLSPAHVTVADMNGDAAPDIIIAHEDLDGVSILLNDGAGAFSDHDETWAGGRDPVAIVAADLNHDGNQDLGVALEFPSSIGVMLGAGDGSITLSENIPLPNTVTALIVLDVNADGNLDLVALTTGDGGVSVLLGDGQGMFAAAPFIPVPHATLAIAAALLDADDVPDLLVGETDRVSTFLGAGDGTFTPGPTLEVESPVLAILPADVNDDGLLDLALSLESTPPSFSPPSTLGAQIFRGLGAGAFDPTPQVYATRGLLVAAIDLDADSDLDLVTGHSSVNTITLLPNRLVTRCSLADFAPPFGLLDFSDLVGFLLAFVEGSVAADLAPAYAQFNIIDVVVFLSAFNEGCP
ncbi:MAG: VCBS repeat-containing protein [Phycisphaerales bacterium]